ncbi:transmembrane protein 8A [Phthorimaea operculella]|nr:transmembrane protein 8A [Phthorimaea operculella]
MNTDDEWFNEIEAKRRMVMDQLTKNRTVLIDGYQLVTRQVAAEVHMYRSYRSVSVVFYRIMEDVSEARFMFQSEELHWNNIGSCQPQEVIVNIKRASYPAVNPDNYEFPKDFISPSSREQTHTVDLVSDGQSKVYTIRNPKPGNWYALVYIKWEDPRTQKVEQQGLVPKCDTIFYTDLQVKLKEHIQIIDCYSGLVVDYNDVPAVYKCAALSTIEPISLNITVTNTNVTNSESILVRIQAQSLPSDEDYLVRCAFDPSSSNINTITFNPYPKSWHYIQLERKRIEHNSSQYADCESYFYRTDLEDTENNHTLLTFMRDDKGRFFTFEYGLPTTDMQDVTSLINITASEIKTVRFKVNELIDIGGNLAIEISLLMSLKYYMGYRRAMKKGALLAFTDENQFFKVVICMDIGHASIPLESGHCKFNDHVKPAFAVLNSTDSESIYKKLLIPYPESGTWYLTFRLFCDKVVCPCRTSHNGTKYYVDAVGSEAENEENISGELTNHTREGQKDCNATVVLSVSSTSCMSGKCHNHGVCMLNTFSGMVMSFCQCKSGYGGWDCSDDSRMDSKAYMYTSTLLLTLSNLLFFISIYIAIIRRYYTEAIMYTFTMVFSTFYHACDAPAEVEFCILKGNILQFGDFYCGIMCFWVTLLAMAIISDSIRSTLQLIGAIVIALLTTWNMHSIVSFMVPVVIGGSVCLVSWCWDYKKKRALSYPKMYYFKHLPAGNILVGVGLICYAFLQTEQNYKIVHSVWHGIIAISVVFLLPDVKREVDVNPFMPSPNFCKVPLGRIFSRTESPVLPHTENHDRVD